MEGEKNIYKVKSRNTFDKIADSYDESHDGKFVKPMYGEVIDRILQINPKNILDVGCGPASILFNLKNKNIKLHGIDISEKMIDEARKKLGSQADLRVGDSEFMPWEDDAFDVVLCNASFHHYPHPLESLKEMTRVLKVGGTLIMGEPTAPFLIRWFTNISVKYSDKGDFKIYSKNEMKDLFKQAGLKSYNYKRVNHQTFIVNGEKM